MRWSIIRTIWFRELRDQLRDRRTIFMILGLPLVLYPLLGAIVLRFAVGFAATPSLIGIVAESKETRDFPPRQPRPSTESPLPLVAWFSATPLPGSDLARWSGAVALAHANRNMLAHPSLGRSPMPTLAWLSATPLPGGELSQWCGAAALAQVDHITFEYPFLIEEERFTTFDRRTSQRQSREWIAREKLKIVFLGSADRQALEDRKVDLIIKASPDFFAKLDAGDDFAAAVKPLLEIESRKDDDRSRLAMRRINALLEMWKQDLKKVRFARKGMTTSFLDPFEIRRPGQPEAGQTQDNVIDLAVRIFPFMLVMWSLAGALYPAVDLCAGEKERGTMETLLITPAGREEIVLGKFLTIWVFSSATALLNLISMGITTAQFAGYVPQGGGISTGALLWCVVLSLPQAAFFSAISLAIGAYARSSKEGQYYLMPLFLVTMPLVFLTLAPGVELNALYSMIPVTGVALLMQKLMTATKASDIPWIYFIPVLAPMGLYSWLALRWAIVQFNREEVLFREAERLDILLWLKSLFRDKEPLPTTGQAFFCLALLIGLHWLSLGLGGSAETHAAISSLAFVAMPALFMALLLNTQPGEALYLRLPSLRETGVATLLALLLMPPMVGLAQSVAVWFPHLLEGRHPLSIILKATHDGADLDAGKLIVYVLAFAITTALCEELAFRGFVLRGLHAHYRPRNAVLLAAFFFAVYHMNVFLFVPTFILGVVLGLLTVRSRSLLPAVLFHLLYNSVLIAMLPLTRTTGGSGRWMLHPLWLGTIATCLISTAVVVWWLYRKPYKDLARREAEEARERGE